MDKLCRWLINYRHAAWLHQRTLCTHQDTRLAIVRVLLPYGGSFLASLCPEAIPFKESVRGVSQKRYFEIDSRFAEELGLVHDGQEVSGGGRWESKG